MGIEIIYWTLLALITFLFVIVLVKSILNELNYFASMDFSQITSRHIEIPVGDIMIYACLYLPKYALDNDNQPIQRLPLIIFNPGWGQEIDLAMTKAFIVPLVLGGPYAVLAYDFRGMGKTPGKREMSPRVLADIPKIIDFALTLTEIDPNRVGFMGFSFGSLVALTQAYPDERIKAIVSVVGLSDCRENWQRKPRNFKDWIVLKAMYMSGVRVDDYTDEINRQMSPGQIMKSDRPDLNQRVFLVNAVHDQLIEFGQFEKNQKILNLPKSQTLVLEKSGHLCLHQELIVLSRIIQFLHTKI